MSASMFTPLLSVNLQSLNRALRDLWNKVTGPPNLFFDIDDDYTLKASDVGKTGRIISATDITITLPGPAVWVPREGDEIQFIRLDAGVPTFAEAAGATILSRDAFLTIGNQYGAAALVADKTVGTWVLIGDLA